HAAHPAATLTSAQFFTLEIFTATIAKSYPAYCARNLHRNNRNEKRAIYRPFVIDDEDKKDLLPRGRLHRQ
ncbi:hypothetical protein, partial [Pectobacterium punjabense]|uniref:hypothetical protein n=1 Tax=Pectobacterium punjabense TaxID=2108399 RepID=UPI001BFFB72A